MGNLHENFNNILPLNRKERFYTGTVLPAIICHENFKHIDRFFKLIRGYDRTLNIQPDADNNNILFQTEYSFKESLVEKHFQAKFPSVYETKDTPDLVILITEPEFILFVGEAKMYSSVNPGEINNQMKNQEWFIEALQKGLNIKKENCWHFAIVPEKLIQRKDTMIYPVIFWEEIISAYSDLLDCNYFLNVLRIALDKFDTLRSLALGNITSFRKNLDCQLTGEKIVELHTKGETFSVGRDRGLHGEKIKADVLTGGWKTFSYEVRFDGKIPNQNWFTSNQFYQAVNNSHFSIPDNKTEAGIEPQVLGPWHFSYLGRDYFLNIINQVGGRGNWDVPLYMVYIGKSGEPYIAKKQGRNVNPNWAALMKDGREYKCHSSSGRVERGLWDKKNCHSFTWGEIKQFFQNQTRIKD